MTSNRKIKRVIRSYMAETGLNYLEARLILEQSGGLPQHDSSTAEAFERRPLGQVLAVTSSRGGTGKTTVALSLASYLAMSSKAAVSQGLSKAPLKVIVLDLDIRDGQVGLFTGFWKPTVMQLLRVGIDAGKIEDTKIYDEGLEVDLLLAPRRPRSADELSDDFYRELIENLKSSYDYIVLDTGGNYLDPIIAEVAYPMADLILMVTDPTTTSSLSMARWILEVVEDDQDSLSIPKQKIGIVVNRAGLGGSPMADEKILASAQGVPIIGSIPNASKIVVEATNTNALERILEDDELNRAFSRIASTVVGSKHTLGELPSGRA